MLNLLGPCLLGAHRSALLSTHNRGLLYWLDLICSSTNLGVTHMTCWPFQYLTMFILCKVDIMSVWVMLVIWLQQIERFVSLQQVSLRIAHLLIILQQDSYIVSLSCKQCFNNNTNNSTTGVQYFLQFTIHICYEWIKLYTCDILVGRCCCKIQKSIHFVHLTLKSK